MRWTAEEEHTLKSIPADYDYHEIVKAFREKHPNWRGDQAIIKKRQRMKRPQKSNQEEKTNDTEADAANFEIPADLGEAAKNISFDFTKALEDFDLMWSDWTEEALGSGA